MIKPTFYLIGAPKAGTTALYTYLKSHAAIGFSDPKEPDYFCTDFSPEYCMASDEEYVRCFAHIRPDRLAVGEGSVTYLFSNEAVPNILAYTPDAKFIVMMRNPIDLVHAWHAQLLYSCDETVRDIEEAWSLQPERAQGRKLPPATIEPMFLQYGKVAELGAQLDRLYSRAARDRIKVIVFDDFIKNPRRFYLEILEFIGAPDDGRAEFPRVNENRVHRSFLVAKFLERPPSLFLRQLTRIKDTTGIAGFGLREVLRKWNTDRMPRRAMSVDFKKTLAAAFRQDIERLSDLLERDLRGWLSAASTSSQLLIEDDRTLHA